MYSMRWSDVCFNNLRVPAVFKAGKLKQKCFLHLLRSNLKMSILCTAASAWLRVCPSPVTLNIHLSALFQIKPTILLFITIDVYSLNFLFSLNTKLQSSKRYSSLASINSLPTPKSSGTMMRSRCRLLASAILAIVGFIESCIAMRGERARRWKDPWLEKISDEIDARYVIVSPYVPGKGKGGTPNDSEDVGFEFPTMAPQDNNESGATNPPEVNPSQRPVDVVGPSINPTKGPQTAAPTVTSLGATNAPPTNAPPTSISNTLADTAAPTTIEQTSACEAAANGDVYTTEESITVRFLYELLSPANRSITDVASNVDEKVQDFLVKELVKCENSNLLTPIGGVGRGEVSTVVEKVCSQLIPSDDSETCHLMTGTVYLYLFTSGPSNGEEVVLSNQEGLDQVEQKLRIAFNGQQRRSLQASFVDKTRGILGLYYIGGRLEEESTGDGDITGIVAGSKDSTSSSVIPSAVVPAVLAVCVASLVAVFIVYRRRRRKLYDSSRDRLLEKDDSTLGEERWEEVKATPDPIRVKVIETTDESESSGSSGAAAAAAHEVVMEDLAGMTVLESLSDISFIKPVFIDPDSVTLYTYSPRIRYQQRDYFFADTIDI